MRINKGTVLISQPYQGDPSFDWTTILLCDHNDEGTYGFILNDKSNLLLKDVIEGFENTNFELFYGGPVDRDALFFIHTIEDLRNSIEISKGVFAHGDFEELKARIALGEVKEKDIRFFLGYSGWDKDQLSDEIERKSWFVNNLVPLNLLDIDINSIWRDLLKEMGGKYKQFSNYPIDPNEN